MVIPFFHLEELSGLRLRQIGRVQDFQNLAFECLVRTGRKVIYFFEELRIYETNRSMHEFPLELAKLILVGQHLGLQLRIWISPCRLKFATL